MTTVGVVAGVIGLAGFVPYFVSAWQERTRPDRATWVVWSVVSVVLAASYVSSGAWSTIWVPIGYALGAVAVAAVALARGGGTWSRLDRLSLAGAALGLIAWALSGEPMTALVLNIFVDLAGAIPTIRSVARDPMSESRSAWSIFLVANTLNLVALTTLSLEHSLYPAYLFLLSAVITVLAVRRPRRLA